MARSARRRIGLLLLALFVGLVTAEGALQIGYLIVWLRSRPAEVAPGSADGTRVLCVGDSFTFGMGASSAEQSYPGQLQRLLAADGRAWRVDNRGWPARNSRELLESLDQFLVQLEPSIVCITVGVNDHWSRPELLELPGELPQSVDGDSAAGGRPPYVLTFRLLRLLKTFRSADPFRDHVATTDPGAAPSADAFLIGRWLDSEKGRRLDLRRGGDGTLDTAPVQWTAVGTRLDVSITGGATIQATWREEAGALVIEAPNLQLRLVREGAPQASSVAKPRNLAATGYAAMSVNDWETGLSVFRECVAKATPAETNLPSLHAAIVRCLMAMGRRDEALREFAIVERLDQERDDFTCKDAMAQSLKALGRAEKADEILEAAIARGGRTPNLWTSWAHTLENRGDIPGARQAIQTALDLAIAAKWRQYAFLLRAKARMHRTGPFSELVAEALVAAHVQDGLANDTRQAFIMWQATPDEKTGAIERACTKAEIPEATRKALLDILRSSFGTDVDPWRVTLRSHLHAIVRRCRQARAKPILGTYPFVFGARDLIREVARAEGVPFVEPDLTFTAIRRNEPTRVLTVADGHCNDDGYGIMAAEFAKAIQAAQPRK